MVPAGGTAVIAVVALAAAVASGYWNETLGTPQHYIRLLNVTLVGGAAVGIAAVRVRRERRFAEVSQIAQVAQRAILPALPARAGHVAIAALYQSAAQGALVGGTSTTATTPRTASGSSSGTSVARVSPAWSRRPGSSGPSASPLRSRPTLTEVACEMDDYLAGFFGEEEFVTVLLVDVTRPGELRIVAAGHPGPELVGADDAALLDLPPGLPLGLGLGRGPDEYAETIVRWNPGDRLLMYTDGLSEARDGAGEFFPVPSLAPRLRSGPVDRVIGEVVAAVTTHVPGGRLEDDLAVVLIENLSGPGTAEPAAGRPSGSDGPSSPGLSGAVGRSRGSARRRPDQLHHRPGVAHHRDVGAVDLHGGGAGPLSHRALGLRRDDPVLAGDEVPAGDGLPRRRAGRGQQRGQGAGRWVAAITSVSRRGRSWAKSRRNSAGSM